jgi:hypothetical protein
MGLISRFTKRSSKQPGSARQQFYTEWERQRANATGPSDLAEIDAIFSRSDRDWS